MATSQESLFSLEVVVEKLYLPYVACRYPAVAFRLLDFPTILISHVEPELATRIRTKISRNPYYQVPNQFADLQDKHGNFLVKKGKSCLFKMSADTLAVHLENTPIYIMVIDEFPEVPKLLGNSSLAMNEIMDAIKKDIRKNGITVPSVQGDKGLFKIYSLMGKEIGYMIIGFRLLSLGPGLIAHLPSAAIATRMSEKNHQEKPKSAVEEVIEAKQQKVVQSEVKHHPRQQSKVKDELSETREMGSMTDVEKCNAFIQTMDFENEKAAVATDNKQKDLKTIQTQTEFNTKRRHAKKEVKVTEKLNLSMEEDSDSNDGFMINQQMACPPPLFYNKGAEPEIHIERDTRPYPLYDYASDDETLEDLSTDDHLEKICQQKQKQSKKHSEEKPVMQDAKTVIITNVKKETNTNQPLLQFVNGSVGSENTFPLLSALMQELSRIQTQQVAQTAAESQKQAVVNQSKNEETQVMSVVKSKAIAKQNDTVNETIKNMQKGKGKKHAKAEKQSKADSSQGVSKQKGFLRKAPETSVQKTKLVFGLTNTQRLRLAKQNPNWLKTAMQDEKNAKEQKQKIKTASNADADLDAGNLSDTFTEVRRLAAAELANTTMALNTNTNRKLKKKKSKSRENSPSKDKSSRGRSLSPKAKKKGRKLSVPEKDARDSTIEEKYSLELDTPDEGMAEPRQDSAADSIPSSRIEVHIPSARAYESDDQDSTFTDSFEAQDPGSDRRDTNSKFPGFNSGEQLPESILREENVSYSSSHLDDDSPLESTRVSKQFRPGDQYRTTGGDTVFKSMEDYDTRQFQSTDEPELQKLMSEDEKSEVITPLTDRSLPSTSGAPPATLNTSLRQSMKFEMVNPTASQQSPLPAVRRSQQLKLDSLAARPTPTDTITPRSRSSGGSPKVPTPRARKPLRERRLEFKKDSIHTESVSSYAPSESENILSLISDGSYSDDFHSEKDMSSRLSTPELPRVSNSQRMIPSTMLGFTIH